MTCKDHELIAKAINSDVSYWRGQSIRTSASEEYRTLQRDNINAAKDICTSLAVLLQADNPNFDRERFLKACGVEQ
jgi:hypothetical protein